MKHLTRNLSVALILLCLCAQAAHSQSDSRQSASRGTWQMASLRPAHELLLRRVSPSIHQPDGPVLYQLIFNASGVPGTVPVFDTNPRHLGNSPITITGGNILVGGGSGLNINGSTGLITFANGQAFPTPPGSGDISGTYPTLTVTGLQGRSVASAAPSTGQVLQFNGTQWVPSTPATGWSLSGNVVGCGTGATPCANFLGSTDNSSLEFQVDGQRAYRIEPATNVTFSSFSPNIIGGFIGNSVTVGVGGATIAGGGASSHVNSVTSDFGTVGGGSQNSAGGRNATVSGGHANFAGGLFSTVAGGFNNLASGNFSFAAGNFANTASGDFSFAAGQHANTNKHLGAFVWGDDSTGSDVTATADNQFVARASGGVIFYTNSGLTTGVQLAAGGGSWSSLSDRNVKNHFAPVDPRALLEQVVALPITTWNYKAQNVSIRHIGPMSQDFFAAFNVGEDDRHITEIDEGGVALASIQGLNQKLEEEVSKLRAQIQKKDAQLVAQQQQIDRLTALLAAEQGQVMSLGEQIRALNMPAKGQSLKYSEAPTSARQLARTPKF